MSFLYLLRDKWAIRTSYSRFLTGRFTRQTDQCFVPPTPPPIRPNPTPVQFTKIVNQGEKVTPGSECTKVAWDTQRSLYSFEEVQMNGDELDERGIYFLFFVLEGGMIGTEEKETPAKRTRATP